MQRLPPPGLPYCKAKASFSVCSTGRNSLSRSSGQIKYDFSLKEMVQRLSRYFFVYSFPHRKKRSMENLINLKKRIRMIWQYRISVTLLMAAFLCIPFFFHHVRLLLIKTTELILGRDLNDEHWHKVILYYTRQLLIILSASLTIFSSSLYYLKKYKLKLSKTADLFCFTTLIAISICLMMSLLTNGIAPLYFLHQNRVDSFMDLFNCLIAASHGTRMNNYPPLANIHYKWLTILIPQEFWRDFTAGRQSVLLRGTTYGIEILTIYLLAFALPFAALLIGNEVDEQSIEGNRMILRGSTTALRHLESSFT